MLFDTENHLTLALLSTCYINYFIIPYYLIITILLLHVLLYVFLVGKKSSQ